jgi:hypothetical protein
VRELPSIFMVLVGGIVAIVLLQKGTASAIEAIISVAVPAVISALSRSQPSDSWSPHRNPSSTGTP